MGTLNICLVRKNGNLSAEKNIRAGFKHDEGEDWSEQVFNKKVHIAVWIFKNLIIKEFDKYKQE